MTILSNKFHVYFNRYSAKSLNEVSVVRNADTFFIMSPVAAHIEKFENYNSYINQKFCVTQKTFSSKRLEDTLNFPLAQPCETMFSYFSFGEKTVQDTLMKILGFLEFELDLRREKFIFRITKHFDISHNLKQMGMKSDQIFLWEKDFSLRLGKKIDRGHYIFLYYTYKHGLIPISAIGFIETPKGFLVDSVLFEDRLAIMHENCTYPYQVMKFKNILAEVEKLIELPYIQSAIIHFVNATILIYLDGCRISNSGSGHILKRLIREISWIFILHKLDIGKIIDILRASVKDTEYAQEKKSSDFFDESILYLSSEIKKAYSSISKNVYKYISKFSVINFLEAKYLRDTFGLREEWIDQYNQLNGFTSFERERIRFSLRNHLYPYADDKIKNFNPISILIEAEAIRADLPIHNK